MPLVTVAQIKTFLELTTSQHDAKLQDCADAASDLAETYCDRRLAQASYDPATTPDDALLNGQDLPFVYTPQWPIISVVSLKLVREGNQGDVQSFTPAQYIIHRLEGKIILAASTMILQPAWSRASRAVFPKGEQNIAITYTAGYATIPRDLQMALTITAAKLHLLGNTRRLGAKSIATTGGGGGGQTNYAIDDIPVEAQRILDRYRAVVPR